MFKSHNQERCALQHIRDNYANIYGAHVRVYGGHTIRRAYVTRAKCKWQHFSFTNVINHTTAKLWRLWYVINKSLSIICWQPTRGPRDARH